MLQRQIVKAVGNYINRKDLVGWKYAAVSFHSIGLPISINVTIYRTMALPESYEINHYIIATKLRRNI
jgi:hypothetical protein